MTMNFNAKELELVFGSASTGDTPEERAKTSSAKFVRSQIQLAPYSEGATGRVLSVREALHNFGWHTLRQAGLEGSAPLVESPSEPALTLRARREELGISSEKLAKKLKISESIIQQAETAGKKTPFKTLESLAQALALNEKVLGLVPNAGKDASLGVRLREMCSVGDIAGFTVNTVLQLSEAAWIIARQADLQDVLLDVVEKSRISMPKHDSNFGYPAYETGYRLASKTRALLGLSPEEPIQSVRKIIEDDFGLPLVQLHMDQRFAGATIANGQVRGIVVNETGMNSNVWVRRMTLCHELGHLLWDPEDRLQRVTVDAYAELEMSDRDLRRDPPEIRANAFAVAFLAPPSAVLDIAKRSPDKKTAVSEVMTTFGISASAATHHISNVSKLDTTGRLKGLPEPEDNWVAMENLTLDYFPLSGVSLSRRGRFAWWVAKAAEIGEISLDSFASLLSVPVQEVSIDVIKRILSLRDELHRTQ